LMAIIRRIWPVVKSLRFVIAAVLVTGQGLGVNGGDDGRWLPDSLVGRCGRRSCA